jgi:hypothetical protein
LGYYRLAEAAMDPHAYLADVITQIGNGYPTAGGRAPALGPIRVAPALTLRALPLTAFEGNSAE